jgi:hypothetical protein
MILLKHLRLKNVRCVVRDGRRFSAMGSDQFAEAREQYKRDPQTLARWLDLSVVKSNGRVHENQLGQLAADVGLRDRSSALVFPSLQVTNLDNESISLPLTGSGSPSLVCFGFKKYGTDLMTSWSIPFSKARPDLICVDLYFIEYSFMSFARSLFLSNLKKSIPSHRHAHSVMAFGGVKDFASELLLPNKYTGYAYLLDDHGRVRWKAAGQVENGEIDLLLDAVDSIEKEG